MCRLGRCGGTEPATGAPDTPRAIGLIGLVGAPLGPQLLVQSSLGVLEALGPRARNRLGLVGASLVEAALGLPQPDLPTL